jgi:hypothetical protein
VAPKRGRHRRHHGGAYYRCRYPAEYALVNRVDSPTTIYVRETVIVPALDLLEDLGDPVSLLQEADPVKKADL